MKSTIIASAIVAGTLFSSAAMACAKPANKPEIPDVATAVTAQMVKANNDVKTYVKDMEAYIGCAGLSRGDEKKEVDDLKSFADNFNQAIRDFKARSAG